MIEVFTTVAHHPKGIDLHLRNLNWALKDKKINVFAFNKFNLPSCNFIISSSWNSNRVFDFHGNFLPALLPTVKNKWILLMQQDILFTEKPRTLQNDRILIDFSSYRGMQYFAIFDQNKQICYPRLWEGAIFYPTSFLIQALKENIAFGYHLNQFRKNAPKFNKFKSKLKNYLFKLPFTTNKFKTIYDYINKPPPGLPVSDKLLEITLFAFCINHEYEVGSESTVHFQGPEKTHRILPNVYNNLTNLKNNPKVPIKNLNNIAFMYYLSEAIEESDELVEFLNTKNNFIEFYTNLHKLSNYAEEWMTKEQLRRLKWAKSKLATPLKIL